MRAWLAAVAAGLVTIAGLALVPSPAAASPGYCPGSGISAVVDFGALGGGIQKFCDAGGVGKTAAQVYTDLGVALTRVDRYPGAVCRVEGKGNASCTAMPPTDQYWGLYWSGGSGWSYASQGVDSLKVPDGGTVAFAWQNTASSRSPATAPAKPGRTKKKPSPSPTAAPPSPKHEPSSSTPASATTRHSAGTPSASTPAASPKGTGRHHAKAAGTPHHAARTHTSVHGTLCHDATGVGVVVDHRSLGGGIDEGCAAHGAARTGDQVAKAAGFRLQYVPGQLGFVCAVARKPRACRMPGAGDPYWGLFWTDGTSGAWKSSSVAVTALKVPAGGTMALVWEDQKKPVKPSVAAPLATATASPSAVPSATRVAMAAAKASTPVGNDSGGVPVWVPIVVVLVLLLGGGWFAVARRRGMG